MKDRKTPLFSLFFLILFVIIGLQIHSLYLAFRFCRLFSRIKVSPETAAVKSEDNKNRLCWAFRVEPKTLNPLSPESDTYTGWIAVPYIFEPLMLKDYNDMSLKPRLAESCTLSRNGLKITFKLKDDIYFSDGHPVTCEDVSFTYRTAVNPEINAGKSARALSMVKSVKILNDKKMTFHLEKPYYKAPEELSFCEIGVLPAHVYEFDDTRRFDYRTSNPLGSGPYILEKWQPGRRIVLKYNKNYWGRKPDIKKIVYKFISNPLAGLQALKNQQVDIMIPEPDQFAEVIQNVNFRKNFYCLSYWTPWTPFYYIGWNRNSVFFNHRNVRLAMTHLMDRRKMVRQLLKGYGKVVTGPFYFKGRRTNPHINPWPCDIARAKELLRRSGWVDTDGDGLRDKNGKKFRFRLIYSTGYALYDRLVRMLKDKMERIGIELVPQPCEWSLLLKKLENSDFDDALAAWGGNLSQDPYKLWHSSQIGNGGSNYLGFKNHRADRIIEKISCELDENRRIQFFHRLHQILHKQQPCTFLFTRPSLRLVDRRFKNVKIYQMGLKYHRWYVQNDK